MLHTDPNINGTGVIIQNASPGFPPFVGYNALQLTNASATSTTSSELDLVGVAAADGFANFAGSVDYDGNASTAPVAVLGAPATVFFLNDPVNQGRATGTITIPTPSTAGAYPFISAAAPSFAATYYRINNSQAFVLETDTSASNWGFVLQQQLP